MNVEWKAHLSQQGAQINERSETEFENIYDADKTHLFDLSWRSLLKVSGSDAQTFLHGQFSNDLSKLNGSNSQLSSYSTPKGRLLGVFRITRMTEDYYLSLPTDIADAFIKRLQMFVMRSDVKIEDLSDTWVSTGISGNDSDQLLQAAALEAPGDVNACCCNDEHMPLIIRVPGEGKRFELYAPLEQMKAFWSRTIETAKPVSSNYWKLQQIKAGLPEIYADTQEAFVAQMVNLHIIDGVNFKKGCYPGQEVIARLQYLGKLKRKMYRASSDAVELPSPGSTVIVEDSDQPSGSIVESARDIDETVQTLLVLKAAEVDAGKLFFLQNEIKTQLNLQSLPYSLVEQ